MNINFDFTCICLSVDQKYWGVATAQVNKRPGVFGKQYMKGTASDVEMTSYALLTYVDQNKIAEALPVVKWLLTQRNRNGGFYSTQVQYSLSFIIALKKLIL